MLTGTLEEGEQKGGPGRGIQPASWAWMRWWVGRVRLSQTHLLYKMCELCLGVCDCSPSVCSLLSTVPAALFTPGTACISKAVIINTLLTICTLYWRMWGGFNYPGGFDRGLTVVCHLGIFLCRHAPDRDALQWGKERRYSRLEMKV